MKNTLTALLPAMALLALGGCASTAGLATSEDDGVYYSSKDRTTAVVAAAPVPASADEAANPDYNGPSRSTARQGSGSDQYYDNTYTYMKGVPTSPGLAYYTPYSPYTTLSYAGGYGYGWGGGACGFSPYPCIGGFYDPFYSSFYSPFYSPFGYGYGYRSGISIGIGFGYGRSFGYGGYSPFGYGYSPFGYGYGGYGGFYDPFYSPYYYGGPFYGGYYGRGGYYGNSYYNGGSYGNNGYDNRNNGRTYGHRTDRASEGRASTAGVSGGSTSAPVPAGGGRMRSEMVTQPGATPSSAGGVMTDRSRGRTEAGSLTATPAQEQSTGGFNRPQRMDRSGQPQFRNMDQLPAGGNGQPGMTAAPDQGQVTRDDSRGRWRNTDSAPQSGQMQPATAPQPVENERRRGGFFRSLAGDQPTNGGGQMTEQPQRRSYEQPRQERTFEQPQRTFEQPQQRSYEQPQRTFSQPSYSAPSYGGGGGGNSGGGGGGGRRGRD